MDPSSDHRNMCFFFVLKTPLWDRLLVCVERRRKNAVRDVKRKCAHTARSHRLRRKGIQLSIELISEQMRKLVFQSTLRIHVLARLFLLPEIVSCGFKGVLRVFVFGCVSAVVMTHSHLK